MEPECYTCTTSSPLITRPNTTSLSCKSGIGAVVINRSNPLLSLVFEVPIINASCFGLCCIGVNIKRNISNATKTKYLGLKTKWCS